MLRKTHYIIIAVMLLISTAGFTVSKHYCGTRLIETSLNALPESCCDSTGTPNCCHNEVMHYQLDDDFTGSITTLLPHPHNNILPAPVIIRVCFLSLKNQVDTESAVDPPDNPTIPLPLAVNLSLIQSYRC